MASLNAQLPVRFYQHDPKQLESCGICLTKGTHPTWVSHRTDGDAHIYHEHCLSEWIKKNPSCPLCRRKIVSIERSLLSAALPPASRMPEKSPPLPPPQYHRTPPTLTLPEPKLRRVAREPKQEPLNAMLFLITAAVVASLVHLLFQQAE